MSKHLSKSVAYISVTAIFLSNFAYAQSAQKVVPPKVYYYMDVSNGGKGIMGGMANLPFMKGRNDNSFGAAFIGMDGKRADMAVKHNDFPNQISANQSIPSGLGLGKSLSLLSTTTEKLPSSNEDKKDKFEIPPESKLKDFKMSFYWGCGATIKAGAPKVFQIKNGQMSYSAMGLSSRGDPAQNQSFAKDAALWPNKKDSRNIGSGASLAGNHAVVGANLPQSLAFNIAQQDFMGDLGLKSSGDKSGVITLNWNGVSGAQGYHMTAMGFSDGEMVFWSSSDVPDMGGGLQNYLTPAKISQYLKEKAILPPSQTKCDIPNGIFKNMSMVMVNGIGYGAESYIVYPPRPTDPKVTWVQEWQAKFRNKTLDHLLVGMPSMGDMMRGQSDSSMSPEEKARLDCEREKSKNSGIGSAIGGAFGGLGGAIGGAIGKSKTKCPTN